MVFHFQGKVSMPYYLFNIYDENKTKIYTSKINYLKAYFLFKLSTFNLPMPNFTFTSTKVDFDDFYINSKGKKKYLSYPTRELGYFYVPGPADSLIRWIRSFSFSGKGSTINFKYSSYMIAINIYTDDENKPIGNIEFTPTYRDGITSGVYKITCEDYTVDPAILFGATILLDMTVRG